MARKTSTQFGSGAGSSGGWGRARRRVGRPISWTSLPTGLEVKPGVAGYGRAGTFTIAGFVMLFALTACNDSDTSSAMTTTLHIAPSTTGALATTTAAASTVTTTATTESAPATTLAVATAPPTTTVEDQLNAAIERAQTAMRNCYAAAPNPCDQAELAEALVGNQLSVVVKDAEHATEGGYHAEHLDRLVWTILDGPTMKGGDLAVATICRQDGVVAVNADGSILSDDEIYFRQAWHLLPVGSTWKLSEVLNLEDLPASEGNPCE